MRKFKIFIASGFAVAAIAAFAFSDEDVPVVDRSQDAEQSVNRDYHNARRDVYNSDATRGLDAVNRTHALQQEVQQLRGLVEVLTHDMKMMQTQQRSLYRDLDKRLETIHNHHQNHSASHASSNEHRASAQGDRAQVEKNHGQPDDPKHFNKQFMRTKHNADDTFLVEQNMYRKAYILIKDKHYQQAITMMKAFLETYPQGRYSANAHYWLGELYLISGDNKTAHSHFNNVMQQFPNHNKAADALFKLGYMAYEAGDLEKARDYYVQVQKQYPATSAAHLAAAKLKRFVHQRHQQKSHQAR